MVTQSRTKFKPLSVHAQTHMQRDRESYLVLTPHIPDSEADVLVFHCLHVKSCKEPLSELNQM